MGVSVDSVTETSFRLNWSPPPEESINGIISSYTISVYEQETEVNTTYSTISTAYIITQLHPFYTYHCSVAASTIAIGPFSDTTTIQTLPSGDCSSYLVFLYFSPAPTGPPLSLQLSTPTPHSIHVSWSPPLTNKTNGIIQYYIVNITVSESSDIYMFEVSSTNLTVEDLHPYYMYHVVVSAFTVALGPYSVSQTVTTLQDGKHIEYFLKIVNQKLNYLAPVGAPEYVTAAAVNSTSIDISWSPPLSHLQNGMIQYYSILVQQRQPTT